MTSIYRQHEGTSFQQLLTDPHIWIREYMSATNWLLCWYSQNEYSKKMQKQQNVDAYSYFVCIQNSVTSVCSIRTLREPQIWSRFLKVPPQTVSRGKSRSKFILILKELDEQVGTYLQTAPSDSSQLWEMIKLSHRSIVTSTIVWLTCHQKCPTETESSTPNSELRWDVV